MSTEQEYAMFQKNVTEKSTVIVCEFKIKGEKEEKKSLGI